MYGVFAKTAWNAPEPPRLEKSRAGLPEVALADRVKSSGTASPPSLLITSLTSLRVGG